MSTNFNTTPVGAPAADADVGDDTGGGVFLEAAYRVADNRTSMTMPFPDDSILRRRAYFRALDQTRRAPTRLVVTDRKV